jgi:spore coat polysaccharide biosynthesis protein SpsF
MTFATEQEDFWRGSFGDEYTDRNRGANWVASNTAFFARALRATREVETILELGSNRGLNLMALSRLLPEAALTAVEINEKAAAQAQANLPDLDMRVQSILDFQPTATWSLVMTKGVLIHISPDKLPIVYRLIYECSSRYIMLSEYYNPVPVEVEYRGHTKRLFKRDFAGDLMDAFPDLQLVDYGFVYHKDPVHPQDDMTWFLLEKT